MPGPYIPPPDSGVLNFVGLPADAHKRQITRRALLRQMAELSVRKAAAVAFPLITAVILSLFGISFLISTLIGLPRSLGLPILARIAGGAILLAGLLVMGWLFRHRGPAKVIVSTYVTFMKILRRTPIAERSGRTEPLVVSGPQRYVRHPLYAGVVAMVLGWALLTSVTFVLVATVAVLIWFRLLLIPFEEKELNALFGDAYRRYSDETPAMVPFTKRRHGETWSPPLTLSESGNSVRLSELQLRAMT
jgi:protein-S-isoprenylcysteine O-methyltransferase Ste14